MIYEQKNTNDPMVVVDNANHIRHGGWYGHYDNDMDVASQSLSWDFHSTRPVRRLTMRIIGFFRMPAGVWTNCGSN